MKQVKIGSQWFMVRSWSLWGAAVCSLHRLETVKSFRATKDCDVIEAVFESGCCMPVRADDMTPRTTGEQYWHGVEAWWPVEWYHDFLGAEAEAFHAGL